MVVAKNKTHGNMVVEYIVIKIYGQHNYGLINCLKMSRKRIVHI